VDSDGEPFVNCPSPAAALVGAERDLCDGTLRGQLVAIVVFAALLALIVWLITRVRPGRLP
jgi:hypothetical protein